MKSAHKKDHRYIRLAHLVSVAKDAFLPNEPFAYPAELSGLPEAISDVQPLIGKSPDVVPFWNCVKAVDRHFTSLKLIQTLDALVKRACGIEPAPLGYLINLRESEKMSQLQAAAFESWKRESGGKFDCAPTDLLGAMSLFRPLLSPQFQQLEKRLHGAVVGALRTSKDKGLEEFAAYAAYLEFQHRRAGWLAKYWDAHEGLHYLLSVLENRDYQLRRNAIIPSTETILPEAERPAVRARFLATEAQKKRRRAKRL